MSDTVLVVVCDAGIEYETAVKAHIAAMSSRWLEPIRVQARLTVFFDLITVLEDPLKLYFTENRQAVEELAEKEGFQLATPLPLPLLIGDAEAEETAARLEALFDQPEQLLDELALVQDKTHGLLANTLAALAKRVYLGWPVHERCRFFGILGSTLPPTRDKHTD